MTIRPPKALAPAKDTDSPLNAALEHEILAEKAATYGRLVKQLEESLAALAEYEADTLPLTASSPGQGPASTPPGGRPDNRPKGGKRERAEPVLGPASGRTRGAGQAAPAEAGPKDRTAAREKERLLNAAGEALWFVMIQREVCGFRRHDLFCRQLGVPAAVRLRMGPVRA